MNVEIAGENISKLDYNFQKKKYLISYIYLVLP